jgi:hypothetical protein
LSARGAVRLVFMRKSRLVSKREGQTCQHEGERAELSAKGAGRHVNTRESKLTVSKWRGEGRLVSKREREIENL